MSNQTMLSLAIESRLPLIYIRTDDVVNVEEVLQFIADKGGPKKTPLTAINLPEAIQKASDVQLPKDIEIFYTSSEVKGGMAKLYRRMVEDEKTIIFINTDKSVLQFDGGVLFPPKELVRRYLGELGLDNAEELLPAFGGLTLKDVGEVAKMTATRDGSVTISGVNTTRRGYSKLQGITQVDTDQSYYVPNPELETYVKVNKEFFAAPKHPSLTPRGTLFDGPPGTGKTEGAKFIANAFGVPLYRLDLGTMMGKYVGESEGNLNAALAQVDEVEPCVVIFDEVEKVFKGTGDSGVTSRMLSQLLWWLQEHKTRVFTVMTTNDMAAIPKELYREGRIDKTMKFLGIASVDACYNFSKGAFDSMLAEMGSEPGDAEYTLLHKRVASLAGSGEPVPQSKLTQLTLALVREVLTEDPDAKAELTAQANALAKPSGGKKIILGSKGPKPVVKGPIADMPYNA